MKRILIIFFCFLLMGSFGLSIEIHFERTTPLYLRNFLQPQIEQISEELSALWGIELDYPLFVTIERKRQLGASGEASFDGKQFDLFMTPATDVIPSLLRHEMMHVYTFQWFFNHNRYHAPLWFVEGLAVWYEKHKGVNIRDVNPVSLFKEIDVLNVDTYPTGDAFARYYSFLSDFFFFLDAQIDIGNSFDSILERLEKTDDYKEAFIDAQAFDRLYQKWKRSRITLSVFGFIVMQFSWFIPAIIILSLGIWTANKRKRIQDIDIRELEKRYGKDYWKKDE